MTNHLIIGICNILNFIGTGFGAIGIVILSVSMLKRIELHYNAYLCFMTAQALYLLSDIIRIRIGEMLIDILTCSFSLVIYIILKKQFYKKLDEVNENI